MMSPRMLQIVSRYQLVAVAVSAVVSLLAWPAGAWGVLAGGAVMAGNFWVLRAMLAKVIDSEGNSKKAFYAVLLATKFFAVMAALALLVVVFELHPVGIALGMMSLFVSVGLGAVHHAIAGARQAT